MEKPNLDLIVDTFFEAKLGSLNEYFTQLKTDLIPQIRKLENAKDIIWFSFLLHGPDQLHNRVPIDGKIYVHIRLGLPDESNPTKFISNLPKHFRKPILTPLSNISGLDEQYLKDQHWAYAWKTLGEASNFVLELLETHGSGTPINIIVQYLHFITNNLMIGSRCLFINGSIQQF